MAKFLLKRKILVKYRYKLKGVELVQLISLLPNSVIKNLKIWKHDKFQGRIEIQKTKRLAPPSTHDLPKDVTLLNSHNIKTMEQQGESPHQDFEYLLGWNLFIVPLKNSFIHHTFFSFSSNTIHPTIISSSILLSEGTKISFFFVFGLTIWYSKLG